MPQKGQEKSSSKDQKAKPSKSEKIADALQDQHAPDLLAGDLLVSSTDSSVDDHAMLLGDKRIPVIQRQVAASKISRIRGNRYLRDVVNSVRESKEAGKPHGKEPQSGLVQRENGDTTTRGGGEYEVQPGDTLWAIARETYGHGRYWRDIYRANPDKASDGGNLILIGTILTLPEIEVPSTAAETPGEEPAPATPEAGPGSTATPADGTETTEEAAPSGETEGAEAAGTGTGEATHPEIVTNDFGSFLIYPDNFVGPLPLSVRSEDSWPIRQSDFDALVERLTAVQDGTSNITISGDEEFTTHTLLDLGWLQTSGVGQELIQQIQDASHNVTITETEGGNGASYDPGADSWETTDTPPRPGPGSNVTVSFNPNRLFISDGSLDWHHRPPAIGLAHEMVHAWTGVYGTRARGEDDAGVRRREQQATGLGEFTDHAITENRFRAAFGLPRRPVY